MTVYVDDYRGRFGRMIMSHMVSDTSLSELHQFAMSIGLPLNWFQPRSTPHYDVCQSKRRLAVQRGAVKVSCRDRKEWKRVMEAAQAAGGDDDV